MLSEQEKHNLAMNIVGKDLETRGFEFLSVNSKLNKNPQFVVLKDKIKYFVVVRAVEFPQPVQEYDRIFMKKIKDHADTFNAKTYYAGVGMGHGSNYENPIVKNEPYSYIYEGPQEV